MAENPEGDYCKTSDRLLELTEPMNGTVKWAFEQGVLVCIVFKRNLNYFRL